MFIEKIGGFCKKFWIFSLIFSMDIFGQSNVLANIENFDDSLYKGAGKKV